MTDHEFTACPPAILALVEKFDRNRDSYRSGQYNEAQLRKEFLVDQMLSLNKQLSSAKTDHEKTALQRQIDATDRQIDQLVYELYGLTDEEIKIVEGN